MIESPLIEGLLAENTQDNIIQVLRRRFGEPSVDVTTRLRAVQRTELLASLLNDAVECPDLEAFRNRILS